MRSPLSVTRKSDETNTVPKPLGSDGWKLKAGAMTVDLGKDDGRTNLIQSCSSL